MSLNKWKVNEIDVLKSTQKGLPAPGSDASYAQGSSPFLLEAFMYACFSSAQAQEADTSFAVPFFWHMYVIDGYEKPLLLQIPSLWKFERIITKRLFRSNFAWLVTFHITNY